MHTEQKVWSSWSVRQQNYLTYPTFTKYFVITWLLSVHVLLWGPFFVGSLFSRTCWTCLNPPLPMVQFFLTVASCNCQNGAGHVHTDERMRTKIIRLQSAVKCCCCWWWWFQLIDREPRYHRDHHVTCATDNGMMLRRPALNRLWRLVMSPCHFHWYIRR